MNKFIILFLLFFSTHCLAANNNYSYPIDNAFAATVIGTPRAFVAALPKDINRKEMSLVVFPDRETPSFLPNKKFSYSLVKQKQAAPLIFVIAGAGAGYKNLKMLMMEKAFYQAGFHVVSLSSPTYANFINTASSTQVPGHIVHDSADLYHVMELIQAQLKNKIKITAFYLTGYSLGGAQAAFISKLDESRKVFNFKKVLMINPPVSLYNSATVLDKMLEDNIPGGMDHYNEFFNDVLNSVSEFYTTEERLEFENDFLYRLYKEKKQQHDLDLTRVAAIIGLAFRISSSSMIFTSDLVTNGGYILPKNHILGKTESTTNYYKVASRVGLVDYFEERLYPFFKELQPNASRASIIEDISLTSIKGYLATADKIAVAHNEDDVILAPGEIDFFRKTFQSRAHIYPTGGHCGNLFYKDNVDYMVNYFKN